jgi:hypothetical protein
MLADFAFALPFTAFEPLKHDNPTTQTAGSPAQKTVLRIAPCICN